MENNAKSLKKELEKHNRIEALIPEFEKQQLNYLTDYTGKLNNHKDYLKMLKVLEKNTEYIEVVLLDDDHENELVNQFSNDIISSKKVNVWWMSIHLGNNILYRIKPTAELFDYLRKLETFCKFYIKNNEIINTEFGYDDIAFYDKNNEILLCTCTHEGYIRINKKILKSIGE